MCNLVKFGNNCADLFSRHFRIIGKLTVLFEDPFWIGVFERISSGKLSVCKVTFGAEPRDYEIQDFILKNYSHLRFSPCVDIAVKKESTNPKRMQREENKLERKATTKQERESEKQRQFELRQQKRREKHRGR